VYLLRVAYLSARTAPNVTMEMLVPRISATQMAARRKLNIADMWLMETDVSSPPNVEKDYATPQLVAPTLPSSSVTTTISVPPIAALMPLVVNLVPVWKRRPVKTQMTVTLPIAIHFLVVSRINSNVTPLTIVLLLLAILNGTTSRPIKMEKLSVANVLTQPDRATKLLSAHLLPL